MYTDIYLYINITHMTLQQSILQFQIDSTTKKGHIHKYAYGYVKSIVNVSSHTQIKKHHDMDIYCIMFIGSPELSLFIMIFPFCRQIRGSSLSVLQKFELWTPAAPRILVLSQALLTQPSKASSQLKPTKMAIASVDPGTAVEVKPVSHGEIPKSRWMVYPTW